MFVRRWSATTWVSSPSPTSPSSTVARAWWARTRSSCRWSESIAQHRKIWLRGEVDKKCKLHLIWFATYWSVKLPAFRRNFQTHVWTHVESQNTNHGVDHRDLSMFLYVFIFHCLKLWAHCRFWNGRPHSEVHSHCQTWGSAGWFRTLVLGPLVVCYTKQNQTCWRWRCQNVPNYLKYTSKVSFIRRQCCCHSSNLITRVHLAVAKLAWDFMSLDLLCLIDSFSLGVGTSWIVMVPDDALRNVFLVC